MQQGEGCLSSALAEAGEDTSTGLRAPAGPGGKRHEKKTHPNIYSSIRFLFYE